MLTSCFSCGILSISAETQHVKMNAIISEVNLMDENAREERRRYQREWRAKNKDRVRAINQRYWANRVQKRLAAQSQEIKGDTVK